VAVFGMGERRAIRVNASIALQHMAVLYIAVPLAGKPGSSLIRLKTKTTIAHFISVVGRSASQNKRP
jgi:hypothetical protein